MFEAQHPNSLGGISMWCALSYIQTLIQTTLGVFACVDIQLYGTYVSILRRWNGEVCARSQQHSIDKRERVFFLFLFSFYVLCFVKSLNSARNTISSGAHITVNGCISFKLFARAVNIYTYIFNFRYLTDVPSLTDWQ